MFPLTSKCIVKWRELSLWKIFQDGVHPHHLKTGGIAISWMVNVLYQADVVKSSHYVWERDKVPQLSPFVQSDFNKLWLCGKG